MKTIDSDAHVVESAHTWNYLDASEKQYRPVSLETREEAGVKLQFWLIDGKVRDCAFRHSPRLSLTSLPSARAGGSKITRSRARWAMSIFAWLTWIAPASTVQVLHNTIFIESVTDRPGVEVALYKSWNRWLADIWRQSNQRLRWSCMAPTLSMPDALDQIRFGKENGACAVLMRPVEGHRLLCDPYFYPIYDEASRLDMAIAIHIANGNKWLNDLYDHPVRVAGTLHRFRDAHGGVLQRYSFERITRGFSQAALGIHRGQRAVAAVGAA